MASSVQSAHMELAAWVGSDHLSDDPAVCRAAAVDGKAPALVVYPSTAEEVAGILRIAATAGLTVIPFRNRTQLDIGNPPERYDVGLSLKEMNNVWHYEPSDLTISVEPGMKLGDLQYLAAQDHLWLPLDPPGGVKASLGGTLATNATGPLGHGYGSPRDVVLGMKIATTEGKIIKTGGRVVKNVAGYDLAKLLIGSYGTLGVIVEANLKLYPLPRQRATYVLRAKSLGMARELRRCILATPLHFLRFLLVNPAGARWLRQGTPLAVESTKPEIWMEAGGSERVLERTQKSLEDLCREAGVSVETCGGAEAESVWNRASEFRHAVVEAQPGTVVVRASLPIAACEEFLSAAQQEAESAEFAALGSPGVGTVHAAISGYRDLGDAGSTIRRLRQSARSFGGALVVERCPVALKAPLDVWGDPGDDFDLMRKIKAAWDPQRTLAPGRMIGRI